MATIDQLMGTALISADRLVVDMSNTIALLQPSAAPLTALTKRLRYKEIATNPKFQWLEDNLLGWTTAVNNVAGYVAGDLSIVVDDASIFNPDDIAIIPSTGECIRITAKDVATNTLTITRGIGSVAAAMVNDDPILILGGASQEGGLSRDLNIQDTVAVYNLCQIFKTTVGVTNTQDNTRTYGPKEHARQLKLKGIEHTIAMERQFWFGTRDEKLAADGQAIRTTGGVMARLTENVWDVPAGVATEADMNEALESVFAYGKDTKIMFASPRWCTTLDGFGRAALRINDKVSAAIGFAAKEYVSTHGRLIVVKNPLFTGAVYGGYAAIMDLDNVKFRPLQGRDTKLHTNVQENGRDGRKDEYRTEAGIEVRLPKTHALFKGLSLA